MWFLDPNMYDIPIETMFVPVGFLLGLKMYLILVGVLVLVLCNNIHWETCTDSSDL